MTAGESAQRFLLDQSADARLIAFLRSLGHDAIRVGADFPPGLPDRDVLALARREERILITDDRDTAAGRADRRLAPDRTPGTRTTEDAKGVYQRRYKSRDDESSKEAKRMARRCGSYCDATPR